MPHYRMPLNGTLTLNLYADFADANGVFYVEELDRIVISSNMTNYVFWTCDDRLVAWEKHHRMLLIRLGEIE